MSCKAGNKSHKARCEKYKQTGRRLINKEKKAEKHKKLMEKFAKRKEEGKAYEYEPNPYKKGSKEYIAEANKRARKNTDHKTPIANFDSVMQHAENYVNQLKQEEKMKSYSSKTSSEE